MCETPEPTITERTDIPPLSEDAIMYTNQIIEYSHRDPEAAAKDRHLGHIIGAAMAEQDLGQSKLAEQLGPPYNRDIVGAIKGGIDPTWLKGKTGADRLKVWEYLGLNDARYREQMEARAKTLEERLDGLSR